MGTWVGDADCFYIVHSEMSLQSVGGFHQPQQQRRPERSWELFSLPGKRELDSGPWTQQWYRAVGRWMRIQQRFARLYDRDRGKNKSGTRRQTFFFFLNSLFLLCVLQWDLLCEDSWKVPFSTSVYLFGVLDGSYICGDLRQVRNVEFYFYKKRNPAVWRYISSSHRMQSWPPVAFAPRSGGWGYT